MKSICFLLPGFSMSPLGGFKVAFEYANRFAAEGYDVTLVYSASMNFRKASPKAQLKMIIRYPYRLITGFSGKKWFDLRKDVKNRLVFSLNQRHVPKADCYVATSLYTAVYLNSYCRDKENDFYLIQDFENWGVSDEFVKKTYRFGFRNIVVSNWLKGRVEDAGAKCTVIPNGFDFDYFRLSIPPEKKERYSVSMLYRDDKRKGSKYGVEALKIVKEKYPQLKARFFGGDPRPEGLPDWIEYHQRPDRATHNKIYNEAAIHLAPSLQEGWGLTVGEAMICGAAIVCTETLGFKEMVTDQETALIAPCGNAGELAKRIIYLFENDDRRIELAKRGIERIRSFTWDASFAKFKNMVDDRP